jgi:anaerobic magnesium-protoporphyrin IX monomethyl ester cyclase
LNDEEAEEYALLAKAALKAPIVIPEIGGAIKQLQNPKCFQDLSVLNDTNRSIHEAIEILSAGWFPHRFSLSRPISPAFDTLSHILNRVKDRKGNPYGEFYVTRLVPRLKDFLPCAIGISLTYPSQVIPAMTLAALLKDRMPDVPVIFGGNMVSTWYDTLEDCADLFDWCDFLIAFEGESSLHRLLSTLNQGGSLHRVPNLVYRFQGKVRKNPVILEELDILPTPDYRGLPLDLYLAPEIVFSLYSSRGCYWSKCRFCAVSPAMRKGHRVRSPERVHADIVTLHQRHQGKFITFVDDCIPPASLSSLATLLKEKGPKIYWQGEVRFEPALTRRLLQRMREAGCLNLIFGLESYVPRVLALMNKGTSREEIDRIISDCRQLGLAFNLQFFFGFPGEEPEEAELTAKFIQAQAHGAATFSFGIFELQRGSQVEKNPEEYALSFVNRERGPLAVKFAYSPKLEHAERIKRSLRAALYERTPYPYAGLSINAHTLIFLSQAGTSALGDIYQKTQRTEPKNLQFRSEMIGWPLILPKKQTVGTFDHRPDEPGRRKNGSRTEDRIILLYNYSLDKILEVSPLVLWLLKGLNGTATPADLVATLQAETTKSGVRSLISYDLLPLMVRAVKDLYERGFLIQSY